jgi:hypothetical protein
MALDLSKLSDAVSKVAGIAAQNKILQDEHVQAQLDIDTLTASLIAATTSPAAAVGLAAVASALAPVAFVAPEAPVAAPVAPVAPVAPLTVDELNARIAAANAAAPSAT